MGQCFAIYNLDKAQVIQPGRFNDGVRLREFGSSPCGVMLALAALLAHGNEHGGIRSHHEIIGTWAGDRIAIIGDDADLSAFSEDLAQFTDISEHILQALCEDQTLRTRLLNDRDIEPPHPQPLAVTNPYTPTKAAVHRGRGAEAAGSTRKQKDTDDT
jgi:hypothetical protein